MSPDAVPSPNQSPQPAAQQLPISGARPGLAAFQPRPSGPSFEADFGDRIEALRDRFDVEILGSVGSATQRYPFYRIIAENNSSGPKTDICLVAGIHAGNEPAPVLAVLKFLETDAGKYLDKFRFVIYPCVNPGGYEASIRQNLNGKDLNRQFGIGSAEEEVVLLETDLQKLGTKYRTIMDFHEDKTDAEPTDGFAGSYTGGPGPDGCYIYETQLDLPKRLGRTLMDTLPPHAKICDWPDIYGDMHDRGVINFSPATTGNPAFAKGTSLDSFVHGRYTDHTFTLETPTCWDMAKRIEVQLHYLTKTLEELGKE
jgi:hypothetical protein